MELNQKSYHLSQSLACHTNAARCVDIAKGLLISGSTDKTVKVFKFVGGKYEKLFESHIFKDFILSVNVNLFDDGFFVGCKDGIVYQLDAVGNLLKKFEGHQGPVCSISQIDKSKLVTGSWDATARVWDIPNGQELLKLEGHSFAVTVLGVSSLGLIVTGSQDKNLNFWNVGNGKLIKQVKEAHDDIIRQIAFVKDIGFLSASNDQTLKLWTFEGEQILNLKGHHNFVFSCAILPFGYYVSSSEDHSIKIWNSKEIVQSILHPSTVWAVSINTSNQDIATSCADGVVRIFTTDEKRKSSEIEIEQFNKKSEIKWNEMYSKDVYAGDKFFPAGKYDDIFDVDIGSGEIKKIPFNINDNPAEVALKFCERENINKEKIDQIILFLNRNTKKQNTSKPSVVPQQTNQNQNQSIPPTEQKQSKFFPISKCLKFKERNLAELRQQIKQFNEILKVENNPFHLTEDHIIILENVLKQIDNEDSAELPIPQAIDIFKSKLSNWPKKYLFPFFDLLRILSLLPQYHSLFTQDDSSLKYISLISETLVDCNSSNEILILCLQVLCNLCTSVCPFNEMLKNQQLLKEFLNKLQQSESNQVKQTLATLIANISIEMMKIRNPNLKVIETFLNQTLENLKNETNEDNLLKYLIACGNYAQINIGKCLNKQTLDKILPTNINDARVVECIRDLKNVI